MALHRIPVVRRLARDDEGLGLMEVVTAMFVLTVLALALLPLLITGMQASVANATLAAATQFANDRVNVAHAAARTSATPCTDIENLSAAPITMIDARGVELVATTTVGDCPAGVGTMTVSAVVTRADTGAVVARASTAVLVTP
jgi:hypothetical protein